MHSEEVIALSGTYDLPQFLLVSDSGPKQHLEEMGIDIKIDLPRLAKS